MLPFLVRVHAQRLPAACTTPARIARPPINFHSPSHPRRSQRPLAARDGLPAFAQTFFDDSAMTTMLARVLGFSVMPITMYSGEHCTYATYRSGNGCRFQFDEPVSKTKFQVRGA